MRSAHGAGGASPLNQIVGSACTLEAQTVGDSPDCSSVGRALDAGPVDLYVKSLLDATVDSDSACTLSCQLTVDSRALSYPPSRYKQQSPILSIMKKIQGLVRNSLCLLGSLYQINRAHPTPYHLSVPQSAAGLGSKPLPRLWQFC